MILFFSLVDGLSKHMGAGRFYDTDEVILSAWNSLDTLTHFQRNN